MPTKHHCPLASKGNCRVKTYAKNRTENDVSAVMDRVMARGDTPEWIYNLQAMLLKVLEVTDENPTSLPTDTHSVSPTMPPNPILVAVPLPPSFLLPRASLKEGLHVTQRRTFGIKSIDRPRPNRYNESDGLPTLLASQKAALQRKLDADTLPLRTGALAIKKGMTAIYNRETGERIPCTVLQLQQNQVVSHKTLEKHGYSAVCMGAGERAAKNITKPMLGHFSIQGVPPKRYLHEFRVRDDTGLLAVGELLKADWFMEGQFVDTRSNCKGKGFAGVMKRWGFHGQNRSHGPSLSHRSMGSAGPSQGGGSRVYPGKKMAGNMGGQRNTVQNLRVLQTDSENGILVVNGAVSGPKGCLVMIQDALKKPWPDVPPPPSPAEINEELREAVGAKGTKTAEKEKHAA